MIFLFFLPAYVAWLCTTSILRYANVLEVLAVPLSVSLINVVWRVGAPQVNRIRQFLLTTAICLGCISFTVVPDWGHRPFSSDSLQVDLSWSEPNTLFLGIYEPASFVAAFFPKGSDDRYMGLGFLDYVTGWPLEKRGREMIDEHKGPIIALVRDDKLPSLILLPKFGLSQKVQNCRALETNMLPLTEPPIWACEVKRI
jgi:hypothetical protein